MPPKRNYNFRPRGKAKQNKASSSKQNGKENGKQNGKEKTAKKTDNSAVAKPIKTINNNNSGDGNSKKNAGSTTKQNKSKPQEEATKKKASSSSSSSKEKTNKSKTSSKKTNDTAAATSSSSSSTPKPFPVGAKVITHGLPDPESNGKVGVIREPSNHHHICPGYQLVYMEASDDKEKTCQLRPVNLLHPFPKGAKVILHGLKKKEALYNGKVGEIRESVDRNGNYKVYVEDSDEEFPSLKHVYLRYQERELDSLSDEELENILRFKRRGDFVPGMNSHTDLKAMLEELTTDGNEIAEWLAQANDNNGVQGVEGGAAATNNTASSSSSKQNTGKEKTDNSAVNTAAFLSMTTGTTKGKEPERYQERPCHGLDAGSRHQPRSFPKGAKVVIHGLDPRSSKHAHLNGKVGEIFAPVDDDEDVQLVCVGEDILPMKLVNLRCPVNIMSAAFLNMTTGSTDQNKSILPAKEEEPEQIWTHQLYETVNSKEKKYVLDTVLKWFDDHPENDMDSWKEDTSCNRELDDLGLLEHKHDPRIFQGLQFISRSNEGKGVLKHQTQHRLNGISRAHLNKLHNDDVRFLIMEEFELNREDPGVLQAIHEIETLVDPSTKCLKDDAYKILESIFRYDNDNDDDGDSDSEEEDEEKDQEQEETSSGTTKTPPTATTTTTSKATSSSASTTAKPATPILYKTVTHSESDDSGEEETGGTTKPKATTTTTTTTTRPRHTEGKENKETDRKATTPATTTNDSGTAKTETSQRPRRTAGTAKNTNNNNNNSDNGDDTGSTTTMATSGGGKDQPPEEEEKEQSYEEEASNDDDDDEKLQPPHCPECNRTMGELPKPYQENVIQKKPPERICEKCSHKIPLRQKYWCCDDFNCNCAMCETCSGVNIPPDPSEDLTATNNNNDNDDSVSKKKEKKDQLVADETPTPTPPSTVSQQERTTDDSEEEDDSNRSAPTFLEEEEEEEEQCYEEEASNDDDDDDDDSGYRVQSSSSGSSTSDDPDELSSKTSDDTNANSNDEQESVEEQQLLTCCPECNHIFDPNKNNSDIIGLHSSNWFHCSNGHPMHLFSNGAKEKQRSTCHNCLQMKKLVLKCSVLSCDESKIAICRACADTDTISEEEEVTKAKPKAAAVAGTTAAGPSAKPAGLTSATISAKAKNDKDDSDGNIPSDDGAQANKQQQQQQKKKKKKKQQKKKKKKKKKPQPPEEDQSTEMEDEGDEEDNDGNIPSDDGAQANKQQQQQQKKKKKKKKKKQQKKKKKKKKSQPPEEDQSTETEDEGQPTYMGTRIYTPDEDDNNFDMPPLVDRPPTLSLKESKELIDKLQNMGASLTFEEMPVGAALFTCPFCKYVKNFPIFDRTIVAFEFQTVEGRHVVVHDQGKPRLDGKELTERDTTALAKWRKHLNQKHPVANMNNKQKALIPKLFNEYSNKAKRGKNQKLQH